MRGKGFAFVEVMIVVTVVGLLCAIAIPSFYKARYMSRLTKMGIEEGGTHPFNVLVRSETREVVEVDDSASKITKVLGKVKQGLSIRDFMEMAADDRISNILYKNKFGEYVPKHERYAKSTTTETAKIAKIVELGSSSSSLEFVFHERYKMVEIEVKSYTDVPSKVVFNGTLFYALQSAATNSEVVRELQATETWQKISKTIDSPF